MKCNYRVSELPFIHPFTTSKGSKSHQPSLIVELDFNGIKGYGESPAISYYDVTVEKLINDLNAKKTFVEKYAFTDPERYWHYLHHLLPNNKFLVCALDIAAWDIYGKWKRKPLYELWGLDMKQAPLTDYTIGIDAIEKMKEKVKEKNWPVYKIKLGTEEDLPILEAIRGITNARLRIDANEGWTLEKALRIIPQLTDLGVELVEQPLPKDDWDGMKKLFHESKIPLIADESCVGEGDVDKCKDCFHGINIKLTKCSGITPARRMIVKARKLGLKIMLGSMNESRVGASAIAHLAPLADYIDIDGPLLLQDDPAKGLEVDMGQLLISGKPGLGIEYPALLP